LLRAAGLHHVAIRTGLRTPRNASTMWMVERHDDADMTSIQRPGLSLLPVSRSATATVAVSSCSAPAPENE
jgi:hypothetical protein